MTVYFIGAGPGDPDLITVKGRDLIRHCQTCLYAGSLVPAAVVAESQAKTIMDSASMTLDDIMDIIIAAHENGDDVARVHSGDPSLYGAIAEQIRRLKAHNIDYKIIPGVPAYAAAAAEMGIELTIPEVTQSIILTRTAMKSSPMPEGDELENLARTKATLAIHLSVRNLREIENVLTPIYGAECPVVIAYRVGWPDQQFLYGTLANIRKKVMAAKITRTALIFVGRGLNHDDGFRDSALYDKHHVHVLRVKRGNKDERGE